MKLRFLILVMFLAAVAQPALPQEASGPLGRDQVLDLVKFGLDSGELAKRIKERGIDFEPTDDYFETLRTAGAQEPVIHALREARPKPLTREQVGKLVAGGVPSQRAAFLVKQRGIDFVADERYLQTLRVAGGDDGLIAALREASADVEAEAFLGADHNAAARAELQKKLKDNARDAVSYKGLAMLDLGEGRFENARQELATAKTLSPDDLEAPYQQALLEITLGNDDKAIAILQPILKQSERSAGQYTGPEANNRAIFLERMGLAYRDEGKFSAAMDLFKQIQALGSAQAPRAEMLIIETLRMQHQPDQAMTEANAAVMAYPKNPDLAIQRATLLGEAGHVDEAVGQLRAFLTNDPTDRTIYTSIAEVYSQAKRFDAAGLEIQKALNLSPNPEDQEYALFVQGAILAQQKKYDQAEQRFTKLLSRNPLNAAAWNYLGYLLTERGVHLQESVKYIQRALELDPNNGAYLDSLGWAYFKMGRYDLAENPLETAARRLPGDPSIDEHLGSLYLRQGKTAQAQQEWQRALKVWPEALSIDFDAERAEKLQKQLDELKAHGAQGKLANE